MKKLLTLCHLAALLALISGCNHSANKGETNDSELYGYVNILLPHIEGMHECHHHPRVAAFTERYRQSGPIIGYYLDDATYPRIDSLGQITFDNYFMIYGDYNRENYDAAPADLPIMQEQLERSLVGTDWQALLGQRTEDVNNTLMVGQPAIIEKYSPEPGVLTMIILMKYQQEGGAESTVASAANCILLKKRLLNMAYYMADQDANTINTLKQRNDAAVKALMAVN